MDRRHDNDRDDRRTYRGGDWDRADERYWDDRRYRSRYSRPDRDEGFLDRAGDRIENWGERAGSRVRGWFEDDDRSRNERFDRGEREPRGWQRPQEDDRYRSGYNRSARGVHTGRYNEDIDRDRDWNRRNRREYDMGQRQLEGAGYSDRWHGERYDVDNRRWDRERDTGGRDFRDRDRREDRGRRYDNRDYGRYEDERGFMDRASDEVRSWFGDDEAERRRQMDERRAREEERARYREGYNRSRDNDETWW